MTDDFRMVSQRKDIVMEDETTTPEVTPEVASEVTPEEGTDTTGAATTEPAN